YAAQTSDQKWHAVVDGKEGPVYEQVTSLRLSRTGRCAYVARKSNDIWDNYMVVDDKEGPKYAAFQPVIFSEDGSHVGYVATSNERPANRIGPPPSVAVIDGKVGPSFEQVTQLTLSPDGTRYAYAGTETGGARVNRYAMVDGKKSIDYQSADNFLFSP